MITEILTLFSSVFSILLTFGILANIVADSNMLQDVSSLLLKEYYKITSLELLKHYQKSD
jgi:hypothetical protein